MSENLITRALSEKDWKLITDALMESSVSRTSEAQTYKETMPKESYEKNMRESKRLVYLVNALEDRLKYSELTDLEKLELINSIKIIDDSASSGEMEYVLVEDNQNNRNILHKIGLTDNEINDKCVPEDGQLDIVVIGFEIANFYNMEKKIFFIEEE